MTAPRPGPIPKAFIFLNGDFDPPPDWPARPDPADLVVGADGGGRHPLALRWPLHALVGDFDSMGEDPLPALAEAGTEIFRHPAAKDEIDFELALELVRRRGYQDIVVLGALGGRWDMTLGNLLLPVCPAFEALQICFRHGPWNLLVRRGPAALEIAGRAGDLLSLLPLGEEVRGLRLAGCLYPLAGETLPAGRSRGLSNELSAPAASLEWVAGALLIVHRAGVLSPDAISSIIDIF